MCTSWALSERGKMEGKKMVGAKGIVHSVPASWAIRGQPLIASLSTSTDMSAYSNSYEETPLNCS